MGTLLPVHFLWMFPSSDSLAFITKFKSCLRVESGLLDEGDIMCY